MSSLISVPDGVPEDDEEPAAGLPSLDGLPPVGLPLEDAGFWLGTTLPLPASTLKKIESSLMSCWVTLSCKTALVQTVFSEGREE